MIGSGFDLQSGIADVSAGECPFAEAGKLRGCRCRAENLQNLPPSNALSRHQVLRNCYERNPTVFSTSSAVGL